MNGDAAASSTSAGCTGSPRNPGGQIVVAAPNPYSVKGFVTRYTPHWFHVWYYRHVLHRPQAG